MAGRRIHRRLGIMELEPRIAPTVYTFNSSDVPKAIPDPGTAASTLVIPDSLSVLDLNVRLNIAHTWDGDLTACLIGPDSTRIQLFDRVGGSGVNFTNTVLDDEAAEPITVGYAPFAGSYQPDQALSAYDGKNAQGVWTLEVSDTVADWSGAITGWSLIVDAPLKVSYSSADAPKPITDLTTITSTLSVPDSVQIVDVNVNLDIAHTYDQNLRVALIAPDSTRVNLFQSVGGAGDNFTNTVLDDEAAAAITAGAAPFSGSYRPISPLSVLDGRNAQGT